jgi:hypothetical protein
VDNFGLTNASTAAAIVETETAIECATKGEGNVGKGQVVRVDTDCVLTDIIRGLDGANVGCGREIGCVYVGGTLEESHFAIAGFNVGDIFKKVKVVLLACHNVCLGEEKKCECCAEHGMMYFV